MEECELCGRKINTAYIINVEGVDLRVCEKCSYNKKVLYASNEPSNASGIKAQANANSIASRDDTDPEMRELVEDYGEAIKTAREGMGLSLKVLAELINEKESFLARVENERAKPNNTLIKKLEKTLDIKLTE
ncbi:multiprotein bridging factor aMBF1 [Candidatus Marsarchaeota archaeon]|nr:multiprotein bridging factor aMBF1 [Candidatus Marsarchaeota archaeon]